MTSNIQFFIFISISKRIHGLEVEASRSESGDMGSVPTGC